MSYNNLHNNHPLINKNQKCLLNRKLITVHSEDRDFNKYPNPNNFAITLPEPIKNIQSIRLLDSIFPADLYIFSNYYQNTKLTVAINFNINYSGPENPFEINGTTRYFEYLHTVTISEGNYTFNELCLELQNSLNNIDSVSGFIVTYSIPEQKFYIANTNNFYFVLIFNQDHDFNGCSYINAFDNNVRWGLGWNLGFKKQIYIPYEHTDTTKDGQINSQSSPWFTAPSDPNRPVYWIKSELCSNIRSAEVIYMEIEKYNSVDELVPNVNNTSSDYINNNKCINNNCNTVCVDGDVKYSNSTNMPKSNYEKVLNSSSGNRTASIKNINGCLNKSSQNDYGGKVNSVFAKIYTRGFNKDAMNESITDSEQGGHIYITTFNNQLEEKISKLHFKFRFHDGTPVDFCNKNFNFSIEFNSIKSDMLSDFDIRDVYNSYS
tara:strand:+ start:1070 stop:2371 length:1302 start_codon:yes stop_codon:yes gene_type:complete